jgi:L-lactate dehydrogenase (cytochrome)
VVVPAVDRFPDAVVKPRDIAALIRGGGRPKPYGLRRLSRCYSIGDLARLARRRLPAAAFAYLDGGGEDEHTLRRNRAAFDELELVPHVLRDVNDIDTSTTVLGTTLPLPMVLAPVGGPRLFHHDGELAVARAAGRAQLPYAVSTLSTVPLERVAATATGPLWFQLYVWGDRGTSKELIARAKAAGYAALVVTVDCTVRSKRERELRAGVTLPTPTLTMSSLLEGALHPSWWWHFLTSDALSFPNLGNAPAAGAATSRLSLMFDGSLIRQDLDWIRAAWGGPLILKGILAADDARRAADEGVQAVVVSNHGGRQLDHVPAAIDALPDVVDAVGERVEVLFDSGVRRGTDVAVALALGARAVLVGRAYLYGLAAAGEAGVNHALDILAEELRITMALSGASAIGDLRTGVGPRRSATRRPTLVASR